MPKVNVIEAVDSFIREHTRPDLIDDPETLLKVSVEAANLVIALGRLSASVRGPNSPGVTRRHAPALGLLARSIKLYEGMVLMVCSNKAELAVVFFRPLLECLATGAYLMRSAPTSSKDFIAVGYRAEVRMIKYLEGVRRKRPLQPIEQRMLRSARLHLREARLSYCQLSKRTNWNLDGKDMASIVRAAMWHGREEEEKGYIFGFMVGSHWTHGTWYDLVTNHLGHRGGRFRARIGYRVPVAAHITPASKMLLRGIDAFEARYRRRGSDELRARSRLLFEFFWAIDSAIERGHTPR